MLRPFDAEGRVKRAVRKREPPLQVRLHDRDVRVAEVLRRDVAGGHVEPHLPEPAGEPPVAGGEIQHLAPRQRRGQFNDLVMDFLQRVRRNVVVADDLFE